MFVSGNKVHKLRTFTYCELGSSAGLPDAKKAAAGHPAEGHQAATVPEALPSLKGPSAPPQE